MALGRSLRASSVKRVTFLIPFGPIRGSLWDPKASQNPSQNALLAEICVRRGVFFAILSATVVFSPFSIHFSTFLFEKSKKKSPCCCTSCRHFPPFQNHAFCRLPCMWSVFLAMCKTVEKNAKNNGKRMKNTSFDFITKIVPKSPSSGLKIDPNQQKMSQKSSHMVKK